MLAAASEFFKTTILVENENNYMFENIDAKTLEEVIRFCYLGEIRLSASNIASVILAAHELKINALKTICSNFLDMTLNSENCLRYAWIAEKYELSASKELANKFFTNNCSKICELKEFQNWNEPQFDEFIESLPKLQDGIFNVLMKEVQTSDFSRSLPRMFSKDLFQAIFRSFVSFMELNIRLDFLQQKII